MECRTPYSRVKLQRCQQGTLELGSVEFRIFWSQAPQSVGHLGIRLHGVQDTLELRIHRV